ncbi:hypothetical protein Ddye_001701 [Dipteronia dyeriana]|uniref:Uncharacterized protein n=1 Tax=Dipteronia dyeriana TaxID=168575 RepID=A0AAD9XPJ1_9ROSI|nr:hypothetical protein Ddye_001701 [Dipteronia dyeriana]
MAPVPARLGSWLGIDDPGDPGLKPAIPVLGPPEPVSVLIPVLVPRFWSRSDGSTALFATVGHFTVRSIQISTCCVVHISSYHIVYQHPEYVNDAFYKSIPGGKPKNLATHMIRLPEIKAWFVITAACTATTNISQYRGPDQ